MGCKKLSKSLTGENIKDIIESFYYLYHSSNENVDYVCSSRNLFVAKLHTFYFCIRGGGVSSKGNCSRHASLILRGRNRHSVILTWSV
jgi:hypothetical protein